MRSLYLKLSLAFVFVSLTAVVLVSLFVRLQTREQFDQFMLDRNQSEVMNELVSYYEENGSWTNIRAILMKEGPPARPDEHRRREFWLPVTLVGLNNRVIVEGGSYEHGQFLSEEDLHTAVAVNVNDETVGFVLFPNAPNPSDQLTTPESRFLESVNTAILQSALAGTAVAFLLGLLLAGTISRPVKKLTEATQLLAQGELGHQVTVNTRDELSELAQSFNQMSADLAQAKQSRQQMTADIAHDLRTPTSVILGYAEALDDGHLQGTAEIYSVLYQEARTLTHLIDDLRLLSLADTGELPLNREWVAPAELLGRVVLSFQSQAAEQGVVLDTAVSPEVPDLFVDPARMKQVLANLVSNALRYTPEHGRVTLSATATTVMKDNHLTLQVTDTGVGIPPADLPHVFDRFYRGDEARHPNGESGLGLAIAKSIVQAHAGTIQVASQLGAGTTFTITLPCEALAMRS